MSSVPGSDFVNATEMARTRFLYGIDKVPDDRLIWSPGGAAGSPLAIADKCAGFLFFVSQMMTHQAMPAGEQAKPAPSESREEVKGRLEAAFGALTAAYETLTPELAAQTITMPWGQVMPLGQMAIMAASVMGYFQGQMNYAQLAYGDEDPNIPPQWKHGPAAQ